MAQFRWNASWTDRGNVLSSAELSALANNTRTGPGTEIANQTNLNQYGKLELNVASCTAFNAGATTNIFMLTAPDGTNYEAGSSSVNPLIHTLTAIIPLTSSTDLQRRMSRVFPLQPAKTKFMLENKTGQTFISTGIFLKLYSVDDGTV